MRKHGENGHIEIVDLTGQTFGWLTVLSYAGSDRSYGAKWLCVCGCTKKTTVRGTALRGKKTVSCGCKARIRLGERFRKAYCNGATPSPDLHSTRFVDPDFDSF